MEYRDVDKMGYSEPKGACIARETQVAEQMGRLDKNICDLSNWVDDLERRLSLILRDQRPEPDECENESVIVPHADALRNMQRRVGFATDRIRSVCDRLEL